MTLRDRRSNAMLVLCQESACKPVKETVTFNLVVAPSVAKK